MTRTRNRLYRWLAFLTAGALVLAGIGAGTVAVADTTPPAGTPSTVSADGLPTWQINGVVWSQAVANNIVYVTGSFTRARPPGVAVGGAGEVPASNLFAYDIRTGNRVTTFNHSLNGQGRVVAAAPDGSRVYVGGEFTTVDGIARGHVAAFDTATGALVSSFHPNLDNRVRGLAVSGPTSTGILFVGGGYGAVNGVTRKSLSAVSTSTGALLPWAPTVDNGWVISMVLAPDRSRVIVGGSFTSLNGQSAYGMGSLNATSGASMPWAANRTIRDATSTGAITSLRTDGVQIFGSGYAYGSGSSFEGTFAADPSTGAITVINDCHGDTYDVLPIGPVLYSVSHVHDCSAVRSFSQISIAQRALAQTVAATTTNKGPDSYGWNYNGLPASTVLQWFPNLVVGTYTGQSQAAWALAGNSSYIALGGEFPYVNNVAQQGLVRLAVASLAPNKQGPTYLRKSSTQVTPPTTATSPAPGSVKVTFGTAWDFDNQTLTYDVRRDNTTWVYSTKVATNFWTLPNVTFTDVGLVPGSQHFYQVRITDAFGNTRWSPTSNTVTS